MTTLHPGAGRPVLALGLMSGTSLDGIDAALVETDGRTIVGRGPALTEPYPAEFRQRLRAVLGTRPDDEARRPEVEAVAHELTLRHAEVARRLLDGAGRAPGAVAVVGFHGHTVAHAPHEGWTWQIGDGALLADRLGIDVVADLRAADVRAGGQGAPLVPVYHAALAAGLPRPTAILNIGGVANVTWIGPEAEAGLQRLIAFDTGPGNALIDDWMARRAGQPFDRDGRAAAAGRVDHFRLARLLDHPYFDRPAPKSLDRNDLTGRFVEGLSVEDGAATLAAFTAAAVGRALAHLPVRPAAWVACGGGRRNPSLIAMIARAVGASITDADALGWDGDAVEAEAFAFLAVRSLAGLPLSFPGTTGVKAPTGGGVHHRARPPASGAAGAVL